MKHNLTLLLLMAATMILTACRSTDKAARHNATTTTTTGSTTTHTAALAVSEAKAIERQRLTQNALTAKVRATISLKGKELSAGGSLKMKRDAVIQLSLNAPLLGMEVFRLEFTPNDVLVVDRIHKEYVRAAYNEVGFLRQAALDFYSLQALFWNELFIPGERTPAGQEQRFSLSSHDGTATLTLADTPRLKYAFRTTDRHYIDRVTVSAHNAADRGRFCWTYANFTAVAGRSFPTTMKMSLTDTGHNMGLDLSLSRLGTDADWETQTKLSSKYTRRPVDEVLARIGNL